MLRQYFDYTWCVAHPRLLEIEISPTCHFDGAPLENAERISKYLGLLAYVPHFPRPYLFTSWIRRHHEASHIRNSLGSSILAVLYLLSKILFN